MRLQHPPPTLTPIGTVLRQPGELFYRKLKDRQTTADGRPLCSTNIVPSRIKTLSTKPRVQLYEGFMEPWECDYMIRLGYDRLERSEVLGVKGNQQEEDERTSDGAFLAIHNDYVVRSLEERIATWSQIPAYNGEHFYLLRYKKGQEYKPHFDTFNPHLNVTEEQLIEVLGDGGPRACTVILYLRSPLAGGATRFPLLDLEVKPKAGDALLFWSYTPDFQFEELSLHQGVPVIAGEKYIATKWLRQNKFFARYPLEWLENTIPYVEDT